MTGDVFEENPFGRTFPDDTSDLGPEVPRIVGTTTLARGAEGLTGVSGEDDVESTAEGLGIECPQIIPDWRGGEITSALGRDEDGAGVIFPLDEGAGMKSGFGKHEAQIQASAACAEGQSVPGT